MNKAEYITTQEIAELLKVNVVTVRRWIKSDRLPAIFLGKEYRVEKEDLEAFLAKGRKKRKIK